MVRRDLKGGARRQVNSDVRRLSEFDVRTFPRALDNFRQLVNARGSAFAAAALSRTSIVDGRASRGCDRRLSACHNLHHRRGYAGQFSSRGAAGFHERTIARETRCFGWLYKYPDGAVKPMSDDEFHDFD
jgi:hypothetical protein